MADVFISYSQKDRELAKSLADFLTECGYDLWWDYELIGGVKFRSEIRSQLEAAKAAIVIWTPTSVESDWVVEEAEEAKHARKLIATRVADLDYRAIPLGFRGVHTELVTEPERILKALDAIGVGPSRAPSAPRRGPVIIDKRLDADAIAKAEQFAHWEFIKDSRDPAAFHGFIEQFPTSSFVALARIQLGKLANEAWEALRNSEDIDALKGFVENFPLDARANEGKDKIRRLEARAAEAASWNRVKDSAEIADVEAHLAAFPDGPNAGAAHTSLQALQRRREIATRWQEIAHSSEPTDFEAFLASYPDSALAAEARARLADIRRAREEADWQAARGAPVPAPVLAFLKKHPSGAHAEDALALLGALPRTIEEEAWALAKDAASPIVVQGFLAAFPVGAYAKAAQAQLAAMARPATGPQRGPDTTAAGTQGQSDEESSQRRAMAKRLAETLLGQTPRARRLAEALLETQYVSDAVALIEELGGRVLQEKKPGFIFNNVEWVVHVLDSSIRFGAEFDLAQWAVNEVAPLVMARPGGAEPGRS